MRLFKMREFAGRDQFSRGYYAVCFLQTVEIFGETVIYVLQTRPNKLKITLTTCEKSEN